MNAFEILQALALIDSLGESGKMYKFSVMLSRHPKANRERIAADCIAQDSKGLTVEQLLTRTAKVAALPTPLVFDRVRNMIHAPVLGISDDVVTQAIPVPAAMADVLAEAVEALNAKMMNHRKPGKADPVSAGVAIHELMERITK